MKKIIGYIREYFSEDVRIGYLAFSFFFILFSLFLNYGFRISRTFTALFHGSIELYYFHALFYGIVFLFGFGSYLITYKRWDLLKEKKWFLLIFVSWITLIGISSIRIENADIFSFLPEETRYLALLCMNYAINSFVYLFFPLAYFFRRNVSESLGLNLKTELTPYWILLLLMVPLIVWASASPSFLKVYPRYYDITAARFLGISPYWVCGFFEIFYLSNFIALEIFFRGFMIQSFVRYLGKGSILPTAMIYCYMHFNKPLEEAFGSFLGGLILGIIAYRTRSIFGGVIVHLGVAFVMEMAAHFFRGSLTY
ncbi:CPBP family intramembrane glutamic endopeptidase [Leptospira sp. WS92.C1]